MQEELDQFDFEDADTAETDQLVEGIDQEISKLNERRYALAYNAREINDALKDDKIAFDPDKAKSLFEEADVLFPDQIVADFVDANGLSTSEGGHLLPEADARSIRSGRSPCSPGR